MAREAKALDPRALSAWHDACIEEITSDDGNEHWGTSCLLATHTGLRSRIIAHYIDSWRVEDTDASEKISLPSGQVRCTLDEDGCHHCHIDRFSGDTGFFGVKKNTAGVGREVPVWSEWMDFHAGKSRPTRLPEMLDTFFATNNTFGFDPTGTSQIVKKVARRRHDVIANQHEGEVECWIGGKKAVVPDIKMHDLRATWATQCLRAGIQDEQVMDWAGWSSRSMIDKYRSELNDPSGVNKEKYAHGRDGKADSSPAEKIARLKEMGLINDGENLSAEELAELESLLS